MAGRIRSFDWASTPLGPIEGWPQSLKTLVDLMLASRSMMSLVWGEAAIHLYNDGFTDLLREHRTLALGRSAYETFARSRDVFEADIAAGMAGRSARLPAQRYPVLRHGRVEEAWFDVDYAPVRDDVGAVGGVLWTLKETTAQHRAEQALRASEEKYRSVFEAIDEGFCIWDVVQDADLGIVDLRFVEVNRAFERQTGLSRVVGRLVSEVAPGTEAEWIETYGEVALTGAAKRFEMHHADTGRWYDIYASQVLGSRSPRVSIVFRDITERRCAEAALRASEERFRQFADASAAGLWIRAADTLAMEFVSPAVATTYGVDRDALLGAVTRWAALIVPEDRDAALAHLEQARSGEVAAHEFRIQRPSDGAFRWIRNTDFPLRDNGHIPRIGGIAEDVTDAKLAAEHSAVLLAELQHRVRNIMALLRSITNRTGERAESVSEYRDLMMGRLLVFSRVQALLTRTANVSVGLASIVHDEVGVQAQHEGQYVLEGADVALAPKAAEVLTLAIHELATNAVKYGALSAPDGRVTVRWSTFERRGGPWLAFDWTEEGAPARPAPAPGTPRRRGFGSELIEGRIPYELRGRGQFTIEPGGARCHLEFPLQERASILQTSAPRRATVFGGAIDMTGEPDLTGRRILVVEDDYYLATDTARALRGAGAEVLGPCATEEDAQAELEEQRPDAVVVDVNLGLGPSFKLAQRLKDGAIPFVFTTGYDAGVIPAEFEAFERLEKPLQLRHIVGAVARLTAAA